MLIFSVEMDIDDVPDVDNEVPIGIDFDDVAKVPVVCNY